MASITPLTRAMLLVAAVSALIAAPAGAAEGDRLWLCVSNEKGGDVTLIDVSTQKIIATIPVGKRPRGIHASPDGRTLFVALSGRPIEGPPKLDAKGNPIFGRDDDDEAERKTDHDADGIGVVDLTTLKFVRKLKAGSDPEQFAVAADGRHLYIANEDVATMSVMNVETGKVEKIVPVGKEPEGVQLSPDGREVYVTCETNGDVFAIDTKTAKVVAHFTVPTRPRNVAFLPDGGRAFVPSESSEQISLVDTGAHSVLKTARLPRGSRPMGLAMHPQGKHLYIATGRGGTVLVMDTTRLEVTNTIAVGKRPWSLAMTP